MRAHLAIVVLASVELACTYQPFSLNLVDAGDAGDGQITGGDGIVSKGDGDPVPAGDAVQGDPGHGDGDAHGDPLGGDPWGGWDGGGGGDAYGGGDGGGGGDDGGASGGDAADDGGPVTAEAGLPCTNIAPGEEVNYLESDATVNACVTTGICHSVSFTIGSDGRVTLIDSDHFNPTEEECLYQALDNVCFLGRAGGTLTPMLGTSC